MDVRYRLAELMLLHFGVLFYFALEALWNCREKRHRGEYQRVSLTQRLKGISVVLVSTKITIRQPMINTDQGPQKTLSRSDIVDDLAGHPAPLSCQDRANPIWQKCRRQVNASERRSLRKGRSASCAATATFISPRTPNPTVQSSRQDCTLNE